MEMRVENLSCARGGITLLERVGFALPSGRALILRGPNGAGKTTLLRTIAGLQPAVAGIISAPPESIAYAAHADGLKATLTAEENLRFWACIHGGNIGMAMARMNLTALADRPAMNLSAGQKRRLGLARMLVAARPIWLLDEPTVSLDADSVALFAGVVADHLASGGSALIATHIDFGLDAETLDLTQFRATAPTFDEAFE